MPVLAPADKVLYTINGTLNGQRTMSTFGLVVTQAVGQPDQAAAFLALRNKLCLAGEVMDKYLACMPNNWTAGEHWFQVVGPTRFVKYAFGNTATGPKSTYPANMPNVAGAIERRGVFADRKNISVLHLPSPTTNDWVDDGIFSIEAVTAYAALGNLIKGEISTPVPNVTYSFSILGTPLATAFPVPIQLTSVGLTSRVMRRRTVGLGI